MEYLVRVSAIHSNGNVDFAGVELASNRPLSFSDMRVFDRDKVFKLGKIYKVNIVDEQI